MKPTLDSPALIWPSHRWIRERFPALASGAIFFDNPGGTQVARPVLDRMTDYLVHTNANHGGVFHTSVASDALLANAHQAMADLLGAASADEIVFGQNMTTLTFALARSLGRWLKPGDEVVVTRLDHDANISPWTTMAADAGATIHWMDFDPSDCTLRMKEWQRVVGPRTKLVAMGYASNAFGTINDIRTVVKLARGVGALIFIDAVQYAPHGPIDVQDLGCDFLVCSAYKFFGPHVGVLYGRLELLERLPAYKVRPAEDRPPSKFETGTLNHEGIAGILGVTDYFAGLFHEATGGTAKDLPRRGVLHAVMASLMEVERTLCRRLLDGLRAIPGVHIWGITDPARLDQRVPTVAFTRDGLHPQDIAKRLAAVDIYVWDGHYYALAAVERLGLLDAGGMVRVGLAHYNTPEEVDRLLEVLRDMRP